MKLSIKKIKHIANLARMELTKQELDKYGGQLSNILGYINQLQEVDTSDVESTAQVSGLRNSLRDDVVESWDEAELEDALSQAPEIEEGQIKVNRVL